VIPYKQGIVKNHPGGVVFVFDPPSRSASGACAKASATACGREGLVQFPGACSGNEGPRLALGFNTVYQVFFEIISIIQMYFILSMNGN